MGVRRVAFVAQEHDLAPIGDEHAGVVGNLHRKVRSKT
jgi:hypothetical protein